MIHYFVISFLFVFARTDIAKISQYFSMQINNFNSFYTDELIECQEINFEKFQKFRLLVPKIMFKKKQQFLLLAELMYIKGATRNMVKFTLKRQKSGEISNELPEELYVCFLSHFSGDTYCSVRYR